MVSYLCIGQKQKNQPNLFLYLVRRSKIFVSVATLVPHDGQEVDDDVEDEDDQGDDGHVQVAVVAHRRRDVAGTHISLATVYKHS